MRFWHFLIFFCFISQSFAIESLSSLEENQFEEGKDYFTYDKPIEIDEKLDGKIIIQSFFDYDCRNCSNVQDILELYAQINASHVIYREYPVALENNEFSARTFYALQAVGRTDVSDKLLFETMDKGQFLVLSRFEHLLAWLEKQGVDGQTFKEMYLSPEISEAARQSIAMTEKYGVFTYPYVVVNGEYVLTTSTLYNDDYTFAVLDFLTTKIVKGNNR
ncbi:thiol:disulfide interchange protein DsbA/DsbL [uncultured Actinobacillus sp.]|uniref:thiol:disulfide interchange protein DsbA/DsbL n=1 Tax=uncultured Actinobacillus sp. TaxID=417616 RepID=UPI0025CE5016|nr:thiol:disulfide interchange protein DsbA/DsbL [uncultured Actinobacillus sp.]